MFAVAVKRVSSVPCTYTKHARRLPYRMCPRARRERKREISVDDYSGVYTLLSRELRRKIPAPRNRHSRAKDVDAALKLLLLLLFPVLLLGLFLLLGDISLASLLAVPRHLLLDSVSLDLSLQHYEKKEKRKAKKKKKTELSVPGFRLSCALQGKMPRDSQTQPAR